MNNCNKLLAEFLVLWALLVVYLEMPPLEKDKSFGEMAEEEITEEDSIQYIFKVPPFLKTDDVDRMAPEYPSSHVQSLEESFQKVRRSGNGVWNSVKDKDGGQNSVVGELEHMNYDATTPLTTSLEHLLNLVTKTKRKCQKMVRIGGSSCRKLKEGAKTLCLDPDVSPEPFSCLGYSFGIGHDFTFDAALVALGCEVFSFDSDKGHSNYSEHPIPYLQFNKIRLGHAMYVEMVKGKDDVDRIVYRPLHRIMKQLGHVNATLDILKIDIENSEWKVFRQSIFKTNILEKTKQLSLEIHFEDFNSKEKLKNETALKEAAQGYIWVLQDLESRGFRLAHYEPNYFAPRVVEIKGRKFHVYCETLWLNPRFRFHEEEDVLGTIYEDYEYPPKDLMEIFMKQQQIKKSNNSSFKERNTI